MPLRLFAFKARDYGFTLVETLVVLVISVGLVALVTLLYRNVAQATKALRSDNSVLMLQKSLRDQFAHGFSIRLVPGVSGRIIPFDRLSSKAKPDEIADLPVLSWFAGTEQDGYLLTWRARTGGANGAPVLAHYRCDIRERAILYRESALPAWWQETFPDLPQLINESAYLPFIKLVDGIETCSFSFFAEVPLTGTSPQGRSSWQEKFPPKLVHLHFVREREINFWFNLRAIDA